MVISRVGIRPSARTACWRTPAAGLTRGGPGRAAAAVLLALALSAPASAAPWTARYNGPGNGDDAATAMALDGSGDVIVAGHSLGSGTGFDFVTLKYSSAGASLWTQRYDGTAHGDDLAFAMALDDSANVFVTGSSSNGVDEDALTLKYGSSGTLSWEARFDGPGHQTDYARAVASDGAGGAFVAAACLADSGDFDLVVLKYSSTGALSWQATYDAGVGGADAPMAMAVDGSGSVIVAARSDGSGTRADFLTIQYSSAGSLLWARRYDGPASLDDWPSAIALDDSGNVFVTGFSADSVTAADCLTLKYSASGMLRWAARYDGSAHQGDAGTAIRVDGGGNVFVAGAATGVSSTADIMLLKYGPTGSLLWSRLTGGPADDWDEAAALAMDGAGNIYLTGATVGIGSSWDYETIEYSAAGDWVARSRYDGPAGDLDVAHALALADSQNVYVTGVSTGSGSGADIATMRLDLTGSVTEVVEGTPPDRFELRQIAPNPAGAAATVEFDLPRPCRVTLALFDVAGRELARVLDRARYAPGRHRAEIAGARRAGVYFCRLVIEEGSRRIERARRIVFIR